MGKLILGAFADEAGDSLQEQIAAMKENGILHLEARNIDGKNFVDMTVAEAKEIKSQLDADGLRIWSIGSPLGKIPITAPFRPHLDKVKHTLELADAVGAERIRMFSFFIPREQDAAIYRDEVMERLSRMLEVSKGSGVKLCHENEKGIYGDIAARCADILAQFPEMGGIFDPANFIQCNQNTVEAWEMLKERIDYFHVKDCLENGHVVPCGKGIGEVAKLLKEYMTLGGNQLTLEPHLTVFKGFDALEQAEQKTLMGEFAYASQREAFDAAVTALKEVLA